MAEYRRQNYSLIVTCNRLLPSIALVNLVGLPHRVVSPMLGVRRVMRHADGEIVKSITDRDGRKVGMARSQRAER